MNMKPYEMRTLDDMVTYHVLNHMFNIHAQDFPAVIKDDLMPDVDFSWILAEVSSDGRTAIYERSTDHIRVVIKMDGSTIAYIAEAKKGHIDEYAAYLRNKFCK